MTTSQSCVRLINRRCNMINNEDITLETFKIYVSDKLKDEYPYIMNRILFYLTNEFDKVVAYYKKIIMNKVSSNDDKRQIGLNSPAINVEDYLEPDENGKIMIQDELYRIDPDVFKVINFITVHEIMDTLRNVVTKEYGIYFKREIDHMAQKEVMEVIKCISTNYLQNIYKQNRFDKRFSDMERNNLIENNMINHPSKTEYIYECIHTSVLIKYPNYSYFTKSSALKHNNV